MGEWDMEPQKDSAVGSFVAKFISILIKLILVGVGIAFLFMGFIVYFGGTGAVPDWMVKGYTNKNYRSSEKQMKQGEYELAIHGFEKAIGEEPENLAMIEESRRNIAYCYEKIVDQLESLSWENTPEGREAARKQNEAYERALEQYNILLKENPKNKTADTARTLLLMKRG